MTLDTKLPFFRSMRGKLLLAFLVLAFIPLTVVGGLAYVRARDALQDAAFDQLETVRELKRDEIARLFQHWENDILVVSSNSNAVGVVDLSAKFYALGTSQMRSLYLGKGALEDAGDGSDYSAVHLEQHRFFSKHTQIYGYEDAFLINSTGYVVYSVRKKDVFGTNLISGPYQNSNLAELYRQLDGAPLGQVNVADAALFDDDVALFIGTPIYKNNFQVGVLVYRVRVRQINAIMQESTGMRQTGETYLVGSDKRMRSDSRFSLSHSVDASFAGTLEENGVDTKASSSALAGDSARGIILDYDGNQVLSAWAPMNVQGLDWVILAEIETSEAFAPVNRLREMMFLIAGIAMLVVIVVTLWIATSLARPVIQITDVARSVAQGNLEVEARVKSNDETSVLASAFNQMIGRLREMLHNEQEQAAKLQQEMAESERLQQELVGAQRRMIQELSTPIIPVMDTSQGGIIVMPLIGSIDSARARDITRRLLAGISAHRAKVVILDITGVPLVDSGVAEDLNKTIKAARLKGAWIIVTGISEAVAETIVDLGVDWSGIETVSDLQVGLVLALNRLGIKLTSF